MKNHIICLIKAEMSNYECVNEMQKELYTLLKRFNKSYSKCSIVKRKYDEAVESFWGKGAKQFVDIRIIQYDNEIIGYVRLERNHEILSIRELYISQKYRSEGVGEKVLTMISNDYAPCLDIESIRLCVDEGNLKAKKFYERNDFDLTIHLYTERVYVMEKKVSKMFNNSIEPLDTLYCSI